MSFQHNAHDFLCHHCQTTICLNDSDNFEASDENNHVIMLLCMHCSEGLDYCVECDRTIDTYCRGNYPDGYKIEEGGYLCSLCEPNNESFFEEASEEEDEEELMQEEFDENPENETWTSLDKRCNECNAYVTNEHSRFLDNNNSIRLYFCHECSQEFDQCDRCHAIVDLKRRGGQHRDGYLYDTYYEDTVVVCPHCAPDNVRLATR